ncbi:MAG: DUF3307 domain-containing protein [Bacteroidales bacterium]|nr:DUF3307 domain-containing protein [Bacteroidales bacterium]
MTLFLQLFLAHILGDFVLQSDAWVKSKQKKKLRSPHLYLHILLHGALVMVLVWDLRFWLPALAIMGSHLMIDIMRLYLPSKNKHLIFFLFDQSLHLLVLVGITFWWQDTNISLGFIQSAEFLIYATGIVFVTLPASVIIRILVSRWYNEAKSSNDYSLQNAGSYIGILERLFILAFVLSGRWEGIGFLIAAKSIFRFADIKGHPDRKLSEYFLIGTLLSIGLAMFTGLILNYLLKNYL